MKESKQAMDEVIVYVKSTVAHPTDENKVVIFNDYIDSPTDEMVERAAKAIYDHDDAYGEWSWEESDDDVNEWYRRMVRAALTAALFPEGNT